MEKYLKDPLLHFLLIGAGLFALYAWVGEDGESGGESEIVVSSGRIEQLANLFVKTWQRPPTEKELKGLIDNYVLEEAYYRSATEMGLDRDDTIVRRRLRQKLEFLSDDAAALVEPTDAELAEYLKQNAERFQRPVSYSFEQVFVKPDKHGEDPVAYAAELLDQLHEQPESKDLGDVSLLPATLEDVYPMAVQSTFGGDFAERLGEMEIGKWDGPVDSSFGLHLIRVRSRDEPEDPQLQEIREEVLREWRNTQRTEVRDEMNQSLLKKYKVVVEWPVLPEAEKVNPKNSQETS